MHVLTSRFLRIIMTQDIDLQPGRITSLRAVKRSPDRISVHIDDRFAFSLHQDVVLAFGLANGKALDVEEQQQMVCQDRVWQARAAALRYVTYRDRTVAEVRRRLRKAYSDEVADEAVGHLQAMGLLDDRAFAEAFADRRFRQDGHGPVRIRADLLKKGVASDVLEEALDKVFCEEDMLADRAAELGSVRWRRLASEPDAMKRTRKVCDYLLRRGYPADLARRVAFDVAREGDRGA